MKLTQFTPEVQKNITQARVQAVDNPAAYGANQSGSQLLGKSIGVALNAYQEAWQKDQNNRVIDATNEYNRRINTLLYDEKDGLTNIMQGKDAEGMQAAYETQEKQIRADIMKQFKLDSKYANQAFQTQTNSSVTSSLSTIDKYQRKGMLDYATNQMTEDYNNTVNAVTRNPNDFTNLWDARTKRAQATMAGLGMDEKEIAVKLDQQLNNMASDILGTMATTNDYENGLDLISKLRALGANENYLKRFEKAFEGKKTVKATGDTAADWFSADATRLDMPENEAWELYQSQNPVRMPTKADGTPLGAVGKAIADATGIDPSVAYGWASMESGRGESSLAAKYNNYFGMKWTGQGYYVELPTEEVIDGQRVTVNAKFQVYDTPEDSAMAAVQWLKDNAPGEIGNIKSAADLARVLKSHGYYTDDEGRYASGVEARSQEYSESTGSPEEQAAYVETAKNAFLAKRAELVKERTERLGNLVGSVQTELFDMVRAGKSPSDQLIYLNSMLDQHPELKQNGSFRSLWTSARNDQISALKAEGKVAGEAQNKIIANLKDRIGVDILTNADLDERLGELADRGVGISAPQRDELVKELYRASHGEGKYGMKIPEDQSEVSAITGIDSKEIGPLYNYAKNVVKQKAWEYKQKYGKDPGYAERRAMWQQAVAEQEIGPSQRGLIFSSYTPTASRAEKLRLGIDKTEWTYDNRGIDAIDIYGYHHYIPTGDWEAVKRGERSLDEFPG